MSNHTLVNQAQLLGDKQMMCVVVSYMLRLLNSYSLDYP